ncbi:hypothetical protein [Deinococcus koreensis]|uniref:Uncharacterized protein n=1 Tax=Deinococcus koreensis TaxID=2054903 RepID=A0A2K3UZW6_9DEIO|nr:hypothetical protein [Deinococcus koreensis]PNY82071.1 hypothetical protein CVO96_12465 [Deinococcus koreensis]
MTLIGWALGLLLGLTLGRVQVQLQGRWAGVAAGLGGLALAAMLGAVLLADSFSRGFVLVYLALGAVLSLLAAVPRLLGGRRPARPEALWVSLGLGAALTASVLLSGLGADALLGALVPPTAKAQVSSGLIPGLLLGTVLGLGWGWVRVRRSSAAPP